MVHVHRQGLLACFPAFTCLGIAPALILCMLATNLPIVSASVCDSFMSSRKSLASLYAFAAQAAESTYVAEADAWTTTATVTVAPPSSKTIAA